MNTDLPNETVVGIKIAVDDTFRVEVGHARRDIFGEGHSLLPGKRLSGVVEQILQRATGYKFGHQVKSFLFVQDANET